MSQIACIGYVERNVTTLSIDGGCSELNASVIYSQGGHQARQYTGTTRNVVMVVGLG